MLTVRSFLFTSWVFITGIIGGTLEMLIFWGPHSWKWAIARAWAAGNLKAGKLLCGLDVTLPETQQAVMRLLHQKAPFDYLAGLPLFDNLACVDTFDHFHILQFDHMVHTP